MVEAFFLHENSLTGSIPSELGQFIANGEFTTTSTAFLLRDNSLCGSIPNEVTTMSTFMEVVHGATTAEFWEILDGNPDVCDPAAETVCNDC